MRHPFPPQIYQLLATFAAGNEDVLFIISDLLLEQGQPDIPEWFHDFSARVTDQAKKKRTWKVERRRILAEWKWEIMQDFDCGQCEMCNWRYPSPNCDRCNGYGFYGPKAVPLAMKRAAE